MINITNLKLQFLERNEMPSISMFLGIVIYMYFRDDKTHKTPHIHVEYQDYEASYSITDGELLAG